jgi:hypothetical protein
MNAIEYVALITILRLVVPVVALLWIGEWARKREPRRMARM